MVCSVVYCPLMNVVHQYQLLYHMNIVELFFFTLKGMVWLTTYNMSQRSLLMTSISTLDRIAISYALQSDIQVNGLNTSPVLSVY